MEGEASISDLNQMKELTPEQEALIEAQMLASMSAPAEQPVAEQPAVAPPPPVAAAPPPPPPPPPAPPRPAVEVPRAQFQDIGGTPLTDESTKRLDLLMDLTLPVAIELGRTHMPIKDILALKRGSVVEFERLASEPVDMLINGRKMAEGEVVVIEKHFALRLTSLVDADERIRGLGR
jgi:flagellar motor switch protein FliN